jgi:hypothetical protein
VQLGQIREILIAFEHMRNEQLSDSIFAKQIALWSTLRDQCRQTQNLLSTRPNKSCPLESHAFIGGFDLARPTWVPDWRESNADALIKQLWLVQEMLLMEIFSSTSAASSFSAAFPYDGTENKAIRPTT